MKWIQYVTNKNGYIFYFIFYCLFTALPAFSENPKKSGLASLKMNHSGKYGVMALSADGNVAVGWEFKNDLNFPKAVR